MKFQERQGDGTTLLESTNSVFGSSDRAFLGVEVVGDPVTAVVANLSAFTVDGAGRFPGSALIDVMDSIDPGVKRWFVAKSSDPRLAGLAEELDLNGLLAQIPPGEAPT